MAAGLNFKFTTSSGEIIDLTSTGVNPDAAPESTPRQGGFTIRNRWNSNNLSAANKRTFGPMTASVAAAAKSANIIKVLKVPARTLVKAPIQVFAVASETIPGHATAGAATKASLNSAGAAGVLGFTGYAYSKPDKSAAVRHIATTIKGQTVLAGCALGGVPVTKFDSHGGGFESGLVEAVDASMTAPALAQVNAGVNAASTKYTPAELYFPYGGYVTLTLGPNDTALGAMASSKGASQAKGLYGYLTGTWEVMADCSYIPE